MFSSVQPLVYCDCALDVAPHFTAVHSRWHLPSLSVPVSQLDCSHGWLFAQPPPDNPLARLVGFPSDSPLGRLTVCSTSENPLGRLATLSTSDNSLARLAVCSSSENQLARFAVCTSPASRPNISRTLKFGIENILSGHSTTERDIAGAPSPVCPLQGKPQRRRPWSRPVFTQLQRRGLEKRFQVQKYITKHDRYQLAAMLGLSETQVKVWFQNRRTKWRQDMKDEERKDEEEGSGKEDDENEGKDTKIESELSVD